MKLLFSLLFVPAILFAEVPKLLDLSNPPKRIIRTCCSFGVDVKVSMMPFVKITDITSVDAIGVHKYLGQKEENNGIIYTQNGGFIDLGHLRDIADYTAYLYMLIKKNKESGLNQFKLGNEGGAKLLSFTIPSSFTNADMANLAGKIAYDLSTWHEISTMYGASYIPMVPERYSSFSVEDAYSNLLGVHLGIKSILSEGDYEAEMTRNIYETLTYLNAVSTVEDTRDAMNQVKDIWWSGVAKLPSRKLLIKRQFEVLNRVSPMIVDFDLKGSPEFDLLTPQTSSTGITLNNCYLLEVKANFKIPVRKALGNRLRDRMINQNDFQSFIDYAELLTNKQVSKESFYTVGMSDI